MDQGESAASDGHLESRLCSVAKLLDRLLQDLPGKVSLPWSLLLPCPELLASLGHRPSVPLSATQHHRVSFIALTPSQGEEEDGSPQKHPVQSA